MTIHYLLKTASGNGGYLMENQLLESRLNYFTDDNSKAAVFTTREEAVKIKQGLEKNPECPPLVVIEYLKD